MNEMTLETEKNAKEHLQSDRQVRIQESLKQTEESWQKTLR